MEKKEEPWSLSATRKRKEKAGKELDFFNKEII